MEQVLGDESLRLRLVAAGLRRAEQFTWEAMALQTLAVYEEVVQLRRAASRA
jgi:glycosyltransferase involved in cell wall biosynthesis